MTKKRANGEGTIVQRKDGSFAAAISLGVVNGKRKRKWVYGQTHKAVADKLRELRDIQDKGVDLERSNWFVSKFLEHWLETGVKPRNRIQTYVCYKSVVTNHLTPNIGGIRLSKLTSEHVQAMLNDLSKKLARQTLISIRGTLHKALTQAIRWGYTHQNAAKYVDIPGQPGKSKARILSLDEVKRLFKAVEGDRLEVLYYLAIILGLRRGELLALQWTDIDFNNKTLTITNSQVWAKEQGYFIGPVKTASSNRTLPLSDKLISLLQAHKARQQAGEYPNINWLFPTEQGKMLSSRSLQEQFNVRLKRAGIEGLRIHDLRHTCASWMMYKCIDPRTAANILGHSTVAMTLNVYTHPQMASYRMAIGLLEGTLDGTLES